jgi:hypothetical protein
MRGYLPWTVLMSEGLMGACQTVSTQELVEESAQPPVKRFQVGDVPAAEFSHRA